MTSQLFLHSQRHQILLRLCWIKQALGLYIVILEIHSSFKNFFTFFSKTAVLLTFCKLQLLINNLADFLYNFFFKVWSARKMCMWNFGQIGWVWGKLAKEKIDLSYTNVTLEKLLSLQKAQEMVVWDPERTAEEGEANEMWIWNNDSF